MAMDKAEKAHSQVGQTDWCDDDLLHVAETMLGASLSDNVVARWQKAKV